jgi:dipeptidyl aminopeptidase/acylaminoacyl peptidase
MPDGWTPRAEAVFELLKGVSSEHADRFIDALGASFVGALEAASPSRQLESLRAETLIMHSVGDALIPVEESRRLAQALQGRVPLHYAEFTLFDHVDVSRALPAATLLREVLRLINHTRMLMRFAI